MPTVNSVSYNKPVLPRVSDTSDLASNRASVYSGKGLDFDGVNDKIDSDFSFVGTQATISFYLSWDSYGTNNVEFILEGNASSNFMIHLGGGAGTNGIRFAMSSATFDNPDSILPGYNHYTLTTNNNTASLYVNGKLFRTQSISLGTANTPYLGIGYRRNSPSFYLNGRLSGLKVFDAVLTATQVSELYNNPEQILPTGVSAVNLKLWLPMMEGAGSYVYNGAAGATGTELVSNGGFDEVCQKWGLSDVATIAITGGKAVWTNPASGGAFADQYISATTGKTYRVTFDYSASDSGFVYIGDQYVSIPSGNGTFTTDITYTSGSARVRLAYGSASALTASIDNVSVKEVVPQATGTISGATWVAGLPEPLPQTALIDWNKGTNLVKYSEDFSNSDWVKNNTTATVDTVSNNSTSGYHRWYQQLSAFTGTGYLSFSVDLKYKDHRYVSFGLTDDSIYRCQLVVDLLSYTITQTELQGSTTLVSSSIAAIGDGWYRLKGTINATGSWAGNIYALGMILNGSSFSTASYVGSGTGVYVRRAQANFGTANIYIPTVATNQSTDIVIPQGLTTGKDIFGNSIAVPRSSGAFNFDGMGSYAAISNNPTITGFSDLTVEGWFKLTGNGTKIGIQKGDSDGAEEYGIDFRTNLIYCDFGGGGTFIEISTTQTVGEWYHIVTTLSGTTSKIYRNGVLENTKTVSGQVNNSGDPLYIGARWYSSFGGTGSTEQGQISNVRVYNYALTAEQVADNYNQKATTFGGSTTISELQAYINRTNAAGATVEAHPSLLNTLTELESK